MLCCVCELDMHVQPFKLVFHQNDWLNVDELLHC